MNISDISSAALLHRNQEIRVHPLERGSIHHFQALMEQNVDATSSATTSSKKDKKDTQNSPPSNKKQKDTKEIEKDKNSVRKDKKKNSFEEDSTEGEAAPLFVFPITKSLENLIETTTLTGENTGTGGANVSASSGHHHRTLLLVPTQSSEHPESKAFNFSEATKETNVKLEMVLHNFLKNEGTQDNRHAKSSFILQTQKEGEVDGAITSPSKETAYEKEKQPQKTEATQNSFDQTQREERMHAKVNLHTVLSTTEKVQTEPSATQQQNPSLEKLFQDTVYQLHTKGKTGQSVLIKLDPQKLPNTTIEFQLQPNNQGVLIHITTSSLSSYIVMKTYFSKLYSVFSNGISSRPIKIEMKYLGSEKDEADAALEDQIVRDVIWDGNES